MTDKSWLVKPVDINPQLVSDASLIISIFIPEALGIHCVPSKRGKVLGGPPKNMRFIKLPKAQEIWVFAWMSRYVQIIHPIPGNSLAAFKKPHFFGRPQWIFTTTCADHTFFVPSKPRTTTYAPCSAALCLQRQPVEKCFVCHKTHNKFYMNIFV